MSEQQTANGGEQRASSTSWILVALFWAYVTIPLAWGIYETFGGISQLFTAG